MKIMTETTFDAEPMRSAGGLKLPEKDIPKFLEALKAYGYESSATFLRRAAYALIRSHEKGERLETPLALKPSRSVFNQES